MTKGYPVPIITFTDTGKWDGWESQFFFCTKAHHHNFQDYLFSYDQSSTLHTEPLLGYIVNVHYQYEPTHWCHRKATTSCCLRYRMQKTSKPNVSVTSRLVYTFPFAFLTEDCISNLVQFRGMKEVLGFLEEGQSPNHTPCNVYAMLEAM